LKSTEQQVQDFAAAQYEELRYALPHSLRYHEWWIDKMIRLADPALLTGRILDNGCGIGLQLDRLSTKRPIGVDLSFGMLQRARRKAPTIVQGDSMRLPFRDQSLDLIFARSLLHHLSTPAAGLSEIRRVLREGGQAILADTNRSLLSNIPRRLAYRGSGFSEQHRNFHRSEYFDAIGNYLALERVEFFGYFAYPFAFPDLMGPLGRVPLPLVLLDLLICLDSVIAGVPGLRSQGWGVMVAARKRECA